MNWALSYDWAHSYLDLKIVYSVAGFLLYFFGLKPNILSLSQNYSERRGLRISSEKTTKKFAVFWIVVKELRERKKNVFPHSIGEKYATSSPPLWPGPSWKASLQTHERRRGHLQVLPFSAHSHILTLIYETHFVLCCILWFWLPEILWLVRTVLLAGIWWLGFWTECQILKIWDLLDLKILQIS